MASVVNCAADGRTVLEKWAEIVSKRELREMPKVKKVTLDQGSPDWLKWRKQGLGGSEVGCVVGANPYKGSQATDIWARKLPDGHPDAQPEISDNVYMRKGREREPLARERYEQLYGWKVDPICAVHDDADYVRASLDGWREDGRVNIEVKCSAAKNHLKYVAISRIEDPFERQTAFAHEFPSYRYQQLYQLLITGAEVSHFVAFNPEIRDPADQFAVFDFYPEPAEMQRLLDRVHEFWRFVVERQPPPPEWTAPCWQLPDPTDLKVPT